MSIRGILKSRIMVFTAGMLIFIGVLGLVLWLIQRVLDGKGTDLYQSHWGINFSAIGALITIDCVVVAAIVGIYLNNKHNKEEKDFLTKYGKNREAD